jgi:class 3 adenylate cyclase
MPDASTVPFTDDGPTEPMQGGASPAGDSKLAGLIIECTLDVVNLRMRLLAGVDPDAVRCVAPLLEAMADEIDRLPATIPVRRPVGFRVG